MAYTNSSLVTYKRITSNRNSPRNHAIDTITIHCYVGQVTAKQGCDYFATTDREVSSNYVVGRDGSIGLSVEEKDRAWTSSSPSNDHRAVTIEVACDLNPPYAVTDAAYKALINLVADICKRNNIKELKWKADKSLIGQVDKQNMTVHRWFSSTACPGEYLYQRHSDIASQVNKKLGATSSSTVSNSTSTSTPSSSTSSNSVSLKFKVGDIVNFVGNKHYSSSYATSGTAVKTSKAKITAVSKSGSHPYHLRAVNDNGAFIDGVYGWVDASAVSAIKAQTTTTPSSSVKGDITAGTKLSLKNIALYVSSVAASKSSTRTGTYYVWSNEIVNNRIRITNNKSNVGKSGQVTGWISYADAKKAIGSTSTVSQTQTTKKSLDDWAREVINGDYGNGALKRTVALKKAGCPYSYKVVQARVNELV